MNSPVRSLWLFCIVLLALGCFAGTAAAAEEPADGQFVVELDANGSADVLFTDEFDLTDPGDRSAFENAREDAEFRQQVARQFREGMRSVSSEASADIDRDIRVGEVTIETRVEGETGIVAYQFRWENLTTVDGDRIVLSEPFSTYSTLDRELVVHAPDGGELTSVSPKPARQDDGVASWPGLTQFGDNFEVIATVPTETEESGTDPPPTFSNGSETYGGAPVALGVSILLLTALFIGREQ